MLRRKKNQTTTTVLPWVVATLRYDENELRETYFASHEEAYVAAKEKLVTGTFERVIIYPAGTKWRAIDPHRHDSPDGEWT